MKIKREFRRRTYVTLAGVNEPPPPPPVTSLPQPAPDPREGALSRLAARVEAQRLEDQRIAQRNQDVTRIDDPVSKVNRRELINAFSNDRAEFLNKLADLFLTESAGISSLLDVQDVISSIIGDSADLNINRANQLIGLIFETKFIQEMTENAGLDPETRRHLLNRYIDRHWGPETPPPTVVSVKTDPNSPMTKKRGPATAEKPSNGEDRPKPAVRPGVSVGPFGALPSGR